MDTKKLRQKILDLAIHGKLVPQDPDDEPASVLLERIKVEKEQLIKEGKIKRSRKSAKTSDTPHYENVPFEIPSSWVWTTGNEIFSPLRSCIPQGDTFIYVDIDAIDNKVNIINNPKIMRTADAPSRATRYTKAGDVLFSMVRPYLRNIAIVPENGWIASTGFYVCSPSKLLLSQYCYYLMLSDYVVDGLNQYMKGDNSPSINNSHILSWLYPIPPLTEQQRIVKEIERWFASIDEIEQDKSDLQTIIKQAKSKILDLAIHGKLVPQDPNDEPAIELLKRINPNFTPCDNGHYLQLPDGWVVVPMQMLCSLTDGEKLDGKEMPNLDVKYLRGERDFKTQTNGRYVAANSLLILVDGENSGEVFRTPIEGYQGSTFKQLHINENMLAEYILHVINLHRKALRENKVGSAIPHLDKKLFKAIEVPVPPYDEQVRIVTAINSMHSKLDAIMENL